MLKTLLLVAAGGSVGSGLRFVVTYALQRNHSGSFPIGTFGVNSLGCLLIGFVVGIAEERQWLSPGARAFLGPGVLGGFTTFSAFGYETVELLRNGETGGALANIGLSLGVGLAAVWLGLRLSRLL